MSPLPPTLPPPGPGPAPAAAAAIGGSPIPAQLAALPADAVIEATVRPMPQGPGLVQLQTPAGPLLVRLPIPLPPGASVRLQVVSPAPALLLRLLTVDGRPTPSGGQAAIAPPETPETAPGAGKAAMQAMAAGEATADQPDGSVALPRSSPTEPGGLPGAAPGIAATLVRPAAMPPAGGSPLPPGTSFTVRIASAEQPQLPQRPPDPPGRPLSALQAPVPDAVGPDTGATPAQDPAAVPPNNPPTPKPAPMAETPPPLLAEAQDPLPDVIDAPLTLPPDLTGTVAANSHVGQTLVQTPLGLVALQPGVTLPAGTRLHLMVVGRPALPETPAGRANGSQQMGPLSPAGWPAFDEAVEILQQTDPQAARQILQHLPQPGPQLALSLFLLVSATQSSSLRDWLGEKTAKALERAGRAGLLDRLEDDLAGMKSEVRMPSGGDWLGLQLPLLLDQRIERIRLTMRRPPQDERERAMRDREGTRFLVDLEMSRLGPLQLDGLVKRASRRFDLIIRTHAALAGDIRRDITGIFCRSLEGFGMTGTASFQQTVNFIEPIPPGPATTPGVII